MAARTMTNAEWRAEGKSLYGPDVTTWKFRCLSCGTVFTPNDFESLGAVPQRAASECIGRVHLERGGLPGVEITGESKPCNWDANGMFELLALWSVESKDGAYTRAWPFADRTRNPDSGEEE
jgi:hypothetical protein